MEMEYDVLRTVQYVNTSGLYYFDPHWFQKLGYVIPNQPPARTDNRLHPSGRRNWTYVEALGLAV